MLSGRRRLRHDGTGNRGRPARIGAARASVPEGACRRPRGPEASRQERPAPPQRGARPVRPGPARSPGTSPRRVWQAPQPARDHARQAERSANRRGNSRPDCLLIRLICSDPIRQMPEGLPPAIALAALVIFWLSALTLGNLIAADRNNPHTSRQNGRYPRRCRYSA